MKLETTLCEHPGCRIEGFPCSGGVFCIGHAYQHGCCALCGRSVNGYRQSDVGNGMCAACNSDIHGRSNYWLSSMIDSLEWDDEDEVDDFDEDDFDDCFDEFDPMDLEERYLD
jgi:hypothetical protein